MEAYSNPVSSLPPPKYNSVVLHPVVRSLLRFLGGVGSEFDSAVMIERIYAADSYPAITLGDIIAAARFSGASLSGVYVDSCEIDSISLPFLTLLKHKDYSEKTPPIFLVDDVSDSLLTISRGNFGTNQISRDYALENWTGIVITHDEVGESARKLSDISQYRHAMEVIPGVLSDEECKSLINYCEEACFEQSRVLKRNGTTINDVVEEKVRDSFSLVLSDRNHPTLARLYNMCAEREGVSVEDIETIQCVRYSDGQKFRPHFDGGVELPRLATYLLYLNDNFEGGGTYFSMMNEVVQPVAGACLRFQSCDLAGRIIWESEHGGLPVSNGVKYALNIWVRCPGVAQDSFSVRSLDRVALEAV